MFLDWGAVDAEEAAGGILVFLDRRVLEMVGNGGWTVFYLLLL